MILAVGEVLMELRRADSDGVLATPGEWAGPFSSGAPAIFASVAARLGSPTGLVGAVGDDALGRHLMARLQRDGVDTGALAFAPGRATALAMVAYDRTGGRDFYYSVRGSAAEAIDPAAAERAASGATWIHVSGSSIGFGDPLAAAVEATVAAGLRAGARLSLDPNLRPDAHTETRDRTAALARQASLVFPSAGELDALGLTTAELVANGALVVATDGSRGAELLGPGDAEPVRVAAPAVEEVDATGAGDSFAAAFLTALVAGAAPTRAATVACAVASHSVTVLGAMEAPVERYDATAG
jgi:tagatose kinase